MRGILIILVYKFFLQYLYNIKGPHVLLVKLSEPFLVFGLFKIAYVSTLFMVPALIPTFCTNMPF